MSLVEIKVPDIGDFKNVDVIEVMVKKGDRIKADQSLVMVESDKASMEIPSSHAGIVKDVRVKLGDKVSEGTPLVVLEAEKNSGDMSPSGEETAVGKAMAAEIKSPVTKASTAAVTPQTSREEKNIAGYAMGEGAHATPSVRRFARELGVNLEQISGTGPKGRITRDDIQDFVKTAMSGADAGASPAIQPAPLSGFNFPPPPSLDFSEFGITELQPLSRIKKISGANLHRNLITIPHVTQHEDADVTELEAFRRSQNDVLKDKGIRLTILAFVAKACVTVLKKYPHFNASLDATHENLILKRYYNIAFAVDTENGLVVPVIKHVDQKGVLEIAQEIAALAAQAREGKLQPSDLQGASFTITSLGSIGGTSFTPFINAPEVSIIGLSRITMKPVWNGSEFVPRLILPLSLAYDHRVIDGAEGVRFVTYLAEVLADMRKTIL